MCVIDIYSKHAWVAHLKDKNGITSTNHFQKVLNESVWKPNKIWVNNGSELYNRSMKSWFLDNDIEMYSTHSEWKFIVAEGFIRTI